MNFNFQQSKFFFGIENLLLSDELIQKLQSNNINDLEDLEKISFEELKKNPAFSEEECKIIFNCFSNYENQNENQNEKKEKKNFFSSNLATDASVLLNGMNQKVDGIYLSENLNKLFGEEWIPCGKLTEICGPPGIGKTSICIQLAINTQLPSFFFNDNSNYHPGKCLYVDTEGGVYTSRIKDFIDSFLVKIKNFDEKKKTNGNEINYGSIIKNISFMRLFDHVQMIALSNILFDYIKNDVIKNPDFHFKLIIIDSITFPFFGAFSKAEDNYLYLNGFLNSLTSVAKAFNIAIVYVNHLTTSQQGGITTYVHSFAKILESHPVNRILAYWENQKRVAKNVKKSYDFLAHFDVKKEGIVDDFVDEKKEIDKKKEIENGGLKEIDNEEIQNDKVEKEKKENEKLGNENIDKIEIEKKETENSKKRQREEN